MGVTRALVWQQRWVHERGLKGVWVIPSSVPLLALPVLSVLCQSGPVAQTSLLRMPVSLPPPTPCEPRNRVSSLKIVFLNTF